MRLRSRLTIALAATALGAVVLVAGVGTALSAAVLENAARQQLTRQAESASDAVRLVEGLRRRTPSEARAVDAALDTLVQQLLRRFGVQGLAADLDRPAPRVREVLGDDGLAQLRSQGSITGTTRVDGQLVAYAATAGPPAVVAFQPLAGTRALARVVGRRLLSAGLLAVAVAGTIGIVLGGRLARPVRQLRDDVRRLEAGALSHRVATDVAARRDEIGELGRGIDTMAARLDAAQDQQRGFFRSVAHELRTPLTNIQGYAEGLRDGAFTSEEARTEAVEVVHDEAVRLGRLVGDVMLLAQLDAGTFEVEPTAGDAADAVRGAVAAAGPVARAAGVAVREEATPTPLHADPDRVRQILDNLVANALRVTPTGGQIVVSCGPEGGDAVLRVRDTGPGLRTEDVPVAFERYELWRRYRGEREVGTGLGLAIVAELARAMGGRVDVDPGGSGVGATFEVRLPANARDGRP